MSDESQPKPVIDYWHIYTDADGISHQTRCQLTQFKQQSMGGAAAQWNDQIAKGEATVVFSLLPVGWFGDWHENPVPQWIVPLSGRWYVESMDGTRVEMGPGDIHFGQDQETTNGKGHRSGQIGDEPCFQIIIQFATSPAAQTRDPFGA